MDYILIGKIKAIVPLPYGLCVKVRETKIGSTSKNGFEIGTYDYTWNCLAQSDAIQRYIKSYFRVGAVVKITGQIEQSSSDENKEDNLRSMKIKIANIDLWNMGDPKKERTRERYNDKVIGDDTPDTETSFKDDF